MLCVLFRGRKNNKFFDQHKNTTTTSEKIGSYGGDSIVRGAARRSSLDWETD